MPKKILAHIGLLVIIITGCGADTLTDPKELSHQRDLAQMTQYDFVNIDADTIIDPTSSLTTFYKSLYQLTHNDSIFQQIPIIHFGDSHIQAGYLTEIIRRRMQMEFGNAGRGMVTPLKLASTNEPRDYSITSSATYENAKITDRNPITKIGITGLGIKSSNPNQVIQLAVHPVPEDTINYSFNRIVIFHDSLAPIITANQNNMADTFGNDIFYNFTTDIDLNSHVDTIDLTTYPENDFISGPYYGFSLENGKNGIIYHSLGQNGACYTHWGSKPEIAEQSVALYPQLIIVSMGANEAAGANFIEKVFYREVDSFISKLKAANPSSSIMLIAPTEAMRRNAPNANYAKVHSTLEKYALDTHIAFLDLYNIMGGRNASREINNVGLLSRDKIHFTAEGYTLQGLLIYNAILDGYNKYVRKNHRPTAL